MLILQSLYNLSDEQVKYPWASAASPMPTRTRN